MTAITRLAAGIVTLFLFLPIAQLQASAATESVLYNFTNPIQQFYDGPSLTSDGAGNFYGVAPAGGSHLSGAVFELSPDGDQGWTYNEIYSFCSQPSCADGETPVDSVIFDSVGNLYGTTYTGGTGCGVVYELSPGAGGWTEAVLADLSGGTCLPLAGLAIDAMGNLYGTSWAGSSGDVFELSPSGGGWVLQVLATNGPAAYSRVAVDAAGNVYGVTEFTVFELSPDGAGGWTQTILHTFTGAPKDGVNPYNAPVLDKSGNLFGTTTGGGKKNFGTVYMLSPGKKGTWKYKVLYSFKAGKKDSSDPLGIALDSAGNLYGFAAGGGGGKLNDGAIFEITAPAGKVGYKERILWSFDGLDGMQPRGIPVLYNGSLYGIAVNGGTSNDGVAFELTP